MSTPKTRPIKKEMERERLDWRMEFAKHQKRLPEGSLELEMGGETWA